MKQQESLESSSGKAERFNTGKLRWGLVDFKSLEPMVEVLEFGAEKYAPDNWKKGLNAVEICESSIRHTMELIDKINSGESLIDHESGKPITGHILCNLMFFNYHLRNNSFTERNNPIKKREDGKY